MKHEEIAHNIAACCQLALLLEVSAYPKPGLVHRTKDFDETRFEHFISSASALYLPFYEAALKGLKHKKLQLGSLIKKAVERSLSWQKGGNTHLGAILLTIPISASAGICGSDRVEPRELRSALRKVLRSMDHRDTKEILLAIKKTMPGGLGRVPYLDVMDEDTYEEIKRKRITPLEAFKVYKDRDVVAYEWSTDYEITFNIGYKELASQLKRMDDINIASVNTFLKLLSKKLDTLIIRRSSVKVANIVSGIAKRIYDIGGLSSRQGLLELKRMDERLRMSKVLRPGATADLLCSSLAILLLEGYRP